MMNGSDTALPVTGNRTSRVDMVTPIKDYALLNKFLLTRILRKEYFIIVTNLEIDV
jgi:hypothetical protein